MDPENQTGNDPIENQDPLDGILDDTPEGDDTEIGDDEGGSEEGEGQDQNVGGDAGGDVEAAPKGRATRRIQSLERERDEANERTRRLEAAIEDLRRGQGTQPDPEAQRREAERLANMDPTERALYESNKQIAELRQQVSSLGFTTTDASDRARFEAKAEINPLYKKYMDRVEQSLAGMRKNGANTTREALLTYMIGEDARKKLESKTGSPQRRAAAVSRVTTSQSRPANARSDVGSGGRSDPNSLQALEKRLSGVAI